MGAESGILSLPWGFAILKRFIPDIRRGLPSHLLPWSARVGAGWYIWNQSVCGDIFPLFLVLLGFPLNPPPPTGALFGCKRIWSWGDDGVSIQAPRKCYFLSRLTPNVWGSSILVSTIV